MGAHIAKPSPPADNAAKADSDLSLEALNLAAENFLNEIRLGQASLHTLGYTLTDRKLTDQEINIVVQTTLDAPKSELRDAVNKLFSHDWQGVVDIIVDSIANFFGGDAPTPQDSAVNDSYSKSFLRWENGSVVQYSIFIQRTNAGSIGTLLSSCKSTNMSIICKGNLDYGEFDPQTILSSIGTTNQKLSPAEITDIMQGVMSELKIAAQIATFKRELLAGGQTKEFSVLLANSADGTLSVDATVPPTFEAARYLSITKGARVKLDNQSGSSFFMNGSLVAKSETATCAIGGHEDYNGIIWRGQKLVAQTMCPVPDGDVTISIQAALGSRTIWAKLGDKTIFSFVPEPDSPAKSAAK